MGHFSPREMDCHVLECTGRGAADQGEQGERERKKDALARGRRRDIQGPCAVASPTANRWTVAAAAP